jgi:hypothetical protein
MYRAFSKHWKKRNACRISVRKPEGKRPLGNTSRKWKNNIKINLREIGEGDMDWVYLAQDTDQWRALVNTVMNLRVPSNFLNGCTIGSFSGRAQLRK